MQDEQRQRRPSGAVCRTWSVPYRNAISAEVRSPKGRLSRKIHRHDATERIVPATAGPRSGASRTGRATALAALGMCLLATRATAICAMAASNPPDFPKALVTERIHHPNDTGKLAKRIGILKFFRTG